MLRLFVAVELSDEWRRHLNSVLTQLRAVQPDAYRWVRPELLHLTVLFLGAQPAGLFPEIRRAVEHCASDCQPFPLSLGALGTFGVGAARVVWVGVGDPSGALGPLRDCLEAELRARRVAYDPKPIRPHITLGRVREAARSGSPPMLTLPSSRRPPRSLVVRELALMQSELGREGARYTALAHAPLIREPL